MGNKIEPLKKEVNNRRAKEHGDIHSMQNHPEHSSSDSYFTTTSGSESKTTSKSKKNATATTPKETVVSSEGCSEFYIACRTNAVDKVAKLLERMNPEEIDKLEPNGSTALHTASYHGHTDVVRLLLEAGADRAIKNKFGFLPYDEALNSNVKELFLRIHNANRLIGNTGNVEWELTDRDVLEKAEEERSMIKTLYDSYAQTNTFKKLFERIETNYIGKGLANLHGIDSIKRFFRNATEEEDPTWIIKAYTAETEFYKTLNIDIACGATQFQNERRYIIALLCHHPSLNSFSFTGLSYRVMKVNDDDINKYKAGCCLMSKSFLSSTIDRKVAELFLARQEEAKASTDVRVRHKADGKVIKSWVMCIYTIRRARTGLHIENSSQYVNEGEILIMPFSVFKVTRVSSSTAKFLPDDLTMTQIELEECDS